MIIVECQQGTPEWFAARIGVCTASRAKDACDRLADKKAKDGKVTRGGPSVKCLGYAAQVAAEIVTGVSYDDTFVNFAMKRGVELEPVARAAYEAVTGHLVQESGIVLTDDRRHGYSTDGLIDDDGLLEIKCPSSALVIVDMWKTGDMSAYMHQMQMGLWLTNRRWVDFVMFDPRLEPIGKAVYLKRVLRDQAFIDSMEDDLVAFMRLVDSNVDALRADTSN